MRRVLSIWLPQLPLDRWRRKGDGRSAGAFAIVREIKNAWRVTHCTGDAIHSGVMAGLTLPDARAICPDLLTEPADPSREDALLRALWRWADCLSPRVAIDSPDGLLLDIAGCAHLFGGEAEMGDHARSKLADMQIEARIGIADTKGAARALARFGGKPINIAPHGRIGELIGPLPIAALDIDKAMVGDLARTGLKTIGQLYAIKSSELARRFGLEFTNVLGAALGQTADPVAPGAADPVYAARMTLPDPIGLLEDIEGVFTRLAESVCERLRRDQKGARRFNAVVRCVDTGDHHLSVGFARPCFEPASILQQFARPLGELKIEFGADWFRLEAAHVEPIRYRQSVLEEGVKADDSLTQILSTLGNRIGFDHVRRFHAQESHLPEREFASVEVVDARADPDWRKAPRARPLRLFRPPEFLHIVEPGRPPKRFQWRKETFSMQRAKGPERLTPEWWRDDDLRTRDYWTVETAEGLTLWLLTYPGTASPEWFVAGRFP